MNKLAASAVAVVVLGLTGAIAGCSSSPSSNPPGSQAQKSAFCGANIALDKASANVTTDSAFLAVLKAHQSDLTTMKNNLPSGSVGSEARDLVNAAQQAISQNSTNPLNNAPSAAGGDIDTYCGVDGNGDPLPSYFASGKGTSFCTTFLPIYEAVGNASSSNDVLSVLEAHKSDIDQLASEVSGLPSSVEAAASSTIQTAQTAIAQNSAAGLQQNSTNPTLVALYCGQNQ